MKKIALLTLLAIIFSIGLATATATLQATISSPANATSYVVNDTITLNSIVNCTGGTGDICGSITATLNNNGQTLTKELNSTPTYTVTDIPSVIIGQGSGQAYHYTNTDSEGNSWNSEQVIGTGGNINDLQTADFNGDGYLDIYTGHTSGGIKVFINTGDYSNYTLNYSDTQSGGDIRGIAVGDLNGDGYIDLAVANDGGNMTYRLNDGNGTSYTVSYADDGYSGLRHVTIADINGDGHQDLIYNEAGANTWYLENNGNATSWAAAVLVHNQHLIPYDLATADFDGDGNLDVAISGYNEVSVNLNTNGDGSVWETHNVTTPASVNMRGLTTGDFDGDGNPDLANTRDSHETFVHLNTAGNGTTWNTSKAGKGNYYITTGDLNRDGLLDIIPAIHSSTNQSLWLKNLGGTFQELNISPKSGTQYAPAVIVPNLQSTNNNPLSIGARTQAGDSYNLTWTLPVPAETQATLLLTIDAQGLFGALSPSTTSEELTLLLNTPTLPPTIDATDPAEGAVNITNATTQLFQVNATDPEADPISYEWFNNGAVIGGETSENYTYNATTVTNYTLTAHANTTDGSDNATWSVQTLLGNQAPTINTFSPTTPHATSVFKTTLYQVNATDPDADPITYKWELDGATQASTNNNYSHTPTLSGTYNITATVNDSIGSNRQEWVVNAANTAPNITNTSPETPINLTGNQDFTITATDPEGQTLTYAWYYDAGLAAETTNTYSYAPTEADNGNHTLKGVASDGEATTNHTWTINTNVVQAGYDNQYEAGDVGKVGIDFIVALGIFFVTLVAVVGIIISNIIVGYKYIKKR